MLGKAYHRRTTSGAILSSGTPIIVYGVVLYASAAAAAITLKNGTSVSANTVLTLTANIDAGTLRDFGGVGVIFPNGCYVEKENDITNFTVFYEVLNR